MSFYDYDYSDYNSKNANSQNIHTSLNEPYYTNLSAPFQVKNTPLPQDNQKFDYAKIIQETKSKRQQQLNELRMNHVRKNASLEARFNIPSATHRLIMPYK